jgi:hypothetical protein
MPEVLRHPPIDVGAVVRRSYRHVAEDFPRLLLVSFGAAAVLGLAELALALLANLLLGHERKASDFTGGWGLILGLAAFGVSIFRYLLMVGIAVHWHRSILAGERSWRYLQIGGREARYLLWLVIWFAIFLIVVILFYSTLRYAGLEFSIVDWLAFDGPPPDDRILAIRLIVTVCAVEVFVAPFYVIALVLPARAVDDKEFGFLAALSATRGNFWRITLASLCFKPVIIAVMLLAFGAGDAATFVWICLEAGFLSFVYRALRGGPAAAER